MIFIGVELDFAKPLFLLSYTKILKTITAMLNFTEVFVGSAINTSDQLVPYKVWTYDGNIEYLTGKHVPLFAVALVLLIFLFFPYTLLLTFGQCIRSMPTRKRCLTRCIRSTAFISIMDAYHAPYNKKHRYLTGFMLLTRCVLFLAFASSYNDNKLLQNMYIITITLIGILTVRIFTANAYKNYYINVLEVCFLLNLATLSATLHYLRSSRSSEYLVCKCTSASISLSMAVFIGILIYHAYLQISKIKYFSVIKNVFFTKRSKKLPTEENKLLCPPGQKLPTTTTVELRKELVDINTS